MPGSSRQPAAALQSAADRSLARQSARELTRLIHQASGVRRPPDAQLAGAALRRSLRGGVARHEPARAGCGDWPVRVLSNGQGRLFAKSGSGSQSSQKASVFMFARTRVFGGASTQAVASWV
jgi:hypothetical protein